MKFVNNANEKIASLEPGETLQEHVLTAAIDNSRIDQSCWNLYLLLPPQLWNLNHDMLRNHGFDVAGTVTTDNVTYLRLKKSIRTSGGSQILELALPTPKVPPSDHERAAIALIEAKYSPEAIEARVRALQEGRAS